MTLPKPRAGILDIEAYVPGDSESAGTKPPVKLSSNETPLGPSPAAVAAFSACSGALHRYPDGSALDLRQAIADHYGLNGERIVCGAGSDELLSLLAQCYLSAGDEGIFTEHGFLVYRIAILASGGVPVVAKETKFTTDVDAILAKVTDRTRIVFIANPNNPTGTYIPVEEVRRLREGLPDDTVLVLDAAYAEYVSKNDYEAGIEIVATMPNTVMTRTFSKIHGLAALRLGWAYCPENVADVLNRVRGPFNVSAPAIAAGAASIQDAAFLDKAVRHNEVWRDWLTDALRELGLTVTPSVANFLLIHFPRKGAHTAAEANAYLKARSILLRAVGAYGLPDALRMSVGTEQENRATVQALARFMGLEEVAAERLAARGCEQDE